MIGRFDDSAYTFARLALRRPDLLPHRNVGFGWVGGPGARAAVLRR